MPGRRCHICPTNPRAKPTHNLPAFERQPEVRNGLSLEGGQNEHPKPAETRVADVIVAGEADREG